MTIQLVLTLLSQAWSIFIALLMWLIQLGDTITQALAKVIGG